MGWVNFTTWEICREALKLAIFIVAVLVLVGLLAMAAHPNILPLDDSGTLDLIFEKPDLPARPLPKGHKVTVVKPYGRDIVSEELGADWLLVASFLLGLIIGWNCRRFRHWIMGIRVTKVRRYEP